MEKIQNETTETEKNLELTCQSAEGAEDLEQVLHNLTKLHVEHVKSEIQDSFNESKDNVEYSLKRGLVQKPDATKTRPISKRKNKNKLALS